MIFTSKAQARKLTNISYLGSVSKTHKHEKSKKFKELTYALYLAPAKLSGYEVCPMRTPECTSLCLNSSGQALMYYDYILKSRINKTKLFFEHRQFFMDWLIFEIKAAKNKADKYGYKFSVRLNNTSDISPLSFYTVEGDTTKNILELFPKIMFYDYTKVPNRVDLMKKYKNYDVTFSFSGLNWDVCTTMLQNNVRVAMVFKNSLPSTFMGHKVINGDDYDMRYRDKKNVIVGLKYKTTKNKIAENSKFVINN
jgi:hypothetical protein